MDAPKMTEFEKNVFEIWREHGEMTPFKVRRSSWAPTSYAVVNKVVIGKWPYGKAYGYFVKNGRKTSYPGCLSCAGCYQWRYEGRGE